MADCLKIADEANKGRLSDDELDALFDLDQHFIHVDTIFDRVFNPSSAATQKDS